MDERLFSLDEANALPAGAAPAVETPSEAQRKLAT